MALTHYIDSEYTRYHRGQELAVCGEWVDPTAHSHQPTCPTCKANVEESDRQFQELMASANARIAPVTVNTFESTAGYKPRERRSRR